MRKNLQAADPHVVVVELSRNSGHMGAIAAGLQTSRDDATIIMDGDFQDPPHVVPELVEAPTRHLLPPRRRCRRLALTGGSIGSRLT